MPGSDHYDIEVVACTDARALDNRPALIYHHYMNLPKPAVLFLAAAVTASGLFAQEAASSVSSPQETTVPAETMAPEETTTPTPAESGTDAVPETGAAPDTPLLEAASQKETTAPQETMAPEESTPSAEAEDQFPFVTGLQGELKNNLLRLSWIDSPHVKGPVYIYRSRGPIESAAGLPRPREIPYGMQSYIDELDGPGTYYYLVVASDEAGLRFDSYILPENSTLILIEDPAPAVAAPPPAPDRVSALAAVVENNRVVISFESAAGAGNLVLYRGVRPIRGAEDILGAAIIQSSASPPVYDYPVPGIPYYYAVIPGEELSQGTVRIKPGVNVTIDPVEVTAARTGQGETRTVPLPLIVLPADPNGAPEIAGLSSEARGALANIRGRPEAATPARSSRILPQDLQTEGGGEEYFLGAIVRGAFANGNWTGAADELGRFLALPRAKNAEARARFYLGQCYYFSDRPRDALFEFLSARSMYPAESGEWIQAILSLLAK